MGGEISSHNFLLNIFLDFELPLLSDCMHMCVDVNITPVIISVSNAVHSIDILISGLQNVPSKHTHTNSISGARAGPGLSFPLDRLPTNSPSHFVNTVVVNIH